MKNPAAMMRAHIFVFISSPVSVRTPLLSRGGESRRGSGGWGGAGQQNHSLHQHHPSARAKVASQLFSLPRSHPSSAEEGSRHSRQSCVQTPHPTIQQLLQFSANRWNPNRIDDFAAKPTHQNSARLYFINAPALEVEDGIRIHLADRRAVEAADVIVSNFELRLCV